MLIIMVFFLLFAFNLGAHELLIMFIVLLSSSVDNEQADGCGSN